MRAPRTASFRLVSYAALLSVAAVAFPEAVRAQTSDQAAARAQVRFREMDLNADGVLTGKEAENCRCRAYDSDGNGQLTKREFYLGFMLAAFENQQGKEAVAPPPQPAEPQRRATRSGFTPGDRVELNVGGTWYPATVLSAKDASYQLARDDRMYGVASSDEWVSESRLRPYVDKPTRVQRPATNLPGSVPLGRYVCVTYGTYNTTVGRLRILGDGVSSGITPDGSGPQRHFTYDQASGEITWPGGFQVAGWTVERAAYAPEANGTPNINLHYRLRAGGNLNSMYCKREAA